MGSDSSGTVALAPGAGQGDLLPSFQDAAGKTLQRLSLIRGPPSGLVRGALAGVPQRTEWGCRMGWAGCPGLRVGAFESICTCCSHSLER